MKKGTHKEKNENGKYEENSLVSTIMSCLKFFKNFSRKIFSPRKVGYFLEKLQNLLIPIRTVQKQIKTSRTRQVVVVFPEL